MKSLKIVPILMIVILLASGCSPEDQLADDRFVDEEAEIVAEPISIVEVDLVYMNHEYVENNGGLELSDTLYKPTSKAFDIIEEDEFFQKVIRELMVKPEGEVTLISAFPETTELLGVNVKGDTLEVDFAGEGLYGGSYQELGIIEQIIRTTRNINRLNEYTRIKQVRFLIDGNEAESLMGHISIAEPIVVD